MNHYQQIFILFTLSSLLLQPAKSCLDLTGTLLTCTENCSSLGCDIPNCEHDCYCTLSSIRGKGCDMSKCEYNCFDDVGIGTDMRNCKSNCRCTRGMCDMRSCQENNNSTDDGDGDGNVYYDDNCFCGGGDCGAKRQVGTIISAFICIIFLVLGSIVFFIYWRKNKRSQKIVVQQRNGTDAQQSQNEPKKQLPSLA